MTEPQHDLAAGFSEPVHNSQACFRALLETMSQPGRIIRIDDLPEVPSPLMPTIAATVLTLIDADTKLYLAGGYDVQGVKNYLTFHTGAPVTRALIEADFVICDQPEALPMFDQLKAGEIDYPDRSATVILAVSALAGDMGVELSGPGIPGVKRFGAVDLDENFWKMMQANHVLYPLGVDVILCEQHHVAAIPRSTRIRIV